ncbi:MAG: hypothetical protein OXN97_25405 [Bryobacterales bacterium]|nr:hypothetical protein [Bryobacterales bacterium]MDE0626096.1 hypothetical protein [Bryobacterales bacterium]
MPERQAAMPDPGGNPLDGNRDRRVAHRDSFETAHRARTTANVANIADKLRQHVRCDREVERFTYSAETNSHLHYKCRNLWRLG